MRVHCALLRLLAQDGVLHGEVPLPVLVLHVHEPRFDAVDLLAQLDDLEMQVDGVLPDLFDPVVEEGEDFVHEGEGRDCHACVAERGQRGQFGREISESGKRVNIKLKK